MTRTTGTVVLGYGVTGKSVVQHLRAQGMEPRVLDTRAQPKSTEGLGNVDVHWQVQEWPADLLAETQQVIVSPGLPLHHTLVRQTHAAGIATASDIDLFMAKVGAPVVGVTGTNGKSTVVSLVGHLLQAGGHECVVGGNLGVPALELLEAPADIYVLELSSFQLAHSAHLALASAGVLNITDDHRDWHGDFESYKRAKERIYVNADYCVGGLNSDCSVDVKVDMSTPDANRWGLARRENALWLFCGDIPLIAVSDLPLEGQHNVENCLWALALVEPWIEPRQAAQLLVGFQGLPHRFEFLSGPTDIHCINDSKATNVGATLAALEGFARDESLILIAGGDSKHADLAPLGEAMQGRVQRLVTLGQDAATLNEVASANGVLWQQVTTMDDAVSAAFEHAKAGDTVLLSPACASLDMYANFVARGDHFKELVSQHTKAEQVALRS